MGWGLGGILRCCSVKGRHKAHAAWAVEARAAPEVAGARVGLMVGLLVAHTPTSIATARTSGVGNKNSAHLSHAMRYTARQHQPPKQASPVLKRKTLMAREGFPGTDPVMMT